MKTILAGVALAALFASPAARADYFQIFDAEGRNFVASARVDIEGRSVYTDRYGRIQVTLPPGLHQARVVVGGTTRSVTLQVDGGDKLKTLRLR